MKKKTNLILTPDTRRQTPVLNELLTKAQQHQQAEKQVLAAIPDALSQGVRFVSCVDGELCLSVESAIVASQLRFRQHQIMESLRENARFRYVWKCRIKVSPRRHTTSVHREPVPLSEKNARLLREEAGHTKDKNLREILEKLAGHARS
ncbi:DciA family protein [Marinobacter sp. X15-166B]|uniref:DciA family protein n=1 Tax=Marinobacter sp. X15-166B TaxID=1897620 RepID=UPI00085BF9E8|nr:DciA family protein [Marinobacter sp. X15-166B]OEY66703.1 hypothetical protein BG841_09730 [Marinobacter sp. X15-166B]